MTHDELIALVRTTLEQLDNYVQEVREDWSGFDGRQNRSIINGITSQLRNAVAEVAAP